MSHKHTLSDLHNAIQEAFCFDNATFGGQRIDPIFGGMLISGQKVAQKLIKRIKNC